jgi:hypothetical protein
MLRKHFVTLVVYIAIAAFLAACTNTRGSDKAATQTALLPDIFETPNISAAPQLHLFNKEIFSRTDGDFVHPKFSPDGSFLAYADVIVANKTEGTQVLLMNMVTRKTHTILSADEANKYATYKVYVTDIEWPDNSTLAVYLSDGDVDVAKVVINVKTGKIISDNYLDEDSAFNDAKYSATKSAILKTFPSWSSEVLDSGFTNNPILIPGRGVITQIAYSGYTDDILFFDTKNKIQKTLLNVGARTSTLFGGGVYVNGRAIFAVSAHHFVYLFKLDKNETVKLVAKYPAGTSDVAFIYEHVLLKNESLFIINRYNTYEQGHNPIFYISSDGDLSELSDCTRCYDYDVTSNGQVAAFSSWQNERRKLAVFQRAK